MRKKQQNNKGLKYSNFSYSPELSECSKYRTVSAVKCVNGGTNSFLLVIIKTNTNSIKCMYIIYLYMLT